VIIIEHARARQARRRRFGLASLAVLGVTVSVAIGVGATSSSSGSGQAAALASGHSVLTASSDGPPCTSSSVESAASIKSVKAEFTPASGAPFDVQTTANGKWSFVSERLPSGQTSVAVYRNGTGAPRYVRSIVIPDTAIPSNGPGEAITSDGRNLLVVDGSGVAVVDTARAESGAPRPVLGTMSAQPGGSGWEVAVTPNGRYAFVTYPAGGGFAVFDLAEAMRSGFRQSGFVGLEVFNDTAGMSDGVAVSPDGHWLYAASALELVRVNLTTSIRRGGNPFADVAYAPFPGCYPNRIVVSSSGKTVWVTDSYENKVFGFSATRITDDPNHALVATVPVGELPVGLGLFDNGQRLLVADSDYAAFDAEAPQPAAKEEPNLVVINTVAALAGRTAVIGSIQSGLWPRSIAIDTSNATALVTNSASAQLESVSLSSIR
jgi:DNA-binding beta-propeller fold protein YncE